MEETTHHVHQSEVGETDNREGPKVSKEQLESWIVYEEWLEALRGWISESSLAKSKGVGELSHSLRHSDY